MGKEVLLDHLSRIYSPNAAQRATREEIISYKTGQQVNTVSPAQVVRQIAAEAEREFLSDFSLPSLPEQREKEDDVLTQRMNQVFEETALTDLGLQRVLAQMSAETYEYFIAQWIEIIELYCQSPLLAADPDLIYDLMDKKCVNQDGRIDLNLVEKKVKKYKKMNSF